MRIGLGLGLGRTSAAQTPAEYLQSLDPVYLRATALVCDGDDWVDVTPGALSEATDATLVIAFAPAAADTYYTLLDGDLTDLEILTFTGGSGQIICRVGNQTATIAQPDGDLHYVTMLFRGGEATDAARLRVYVDGTEVTGGDITHGTIPAAIPALAAVRLGARTNDAGPFSGTIKCAAVYASDQSANLAAIHAAVASIAGL